MKVFYLLVGNKEYPSVRERVLKYLDDLYNCGVGSSIYIAGQRSSGVASYYGYLAKNAISADAIFIHRLPLTVTEFNVIRALNKNIIFDFDDALFAYNGATPSDEHYKAHLDRKYVIDYIIRNSKLIIAGNEYLKEYARPLNENVIVIPTCIDTGVYSSSVVETTNDKVIIGWIGLSSNLRYVISISNAIRKGLTGRKDVVFKIVSDNFIDIAGIDIVKKQWKLQEEVSDVGTFDIGIMPLDDNEWTRGKCSYKALLYMAMGIPVVLSPVGMNKEIVEDGVSGFFATTEGEWVEKLSILIEDSTLRHQMGIKGRRVVEERYSKKVGLDMLLSAIKLVTA